MAEYVASPSCIKLHMQTSRIFKEKGFTHQNTCYRMVNRNYSYQRWNYVHSLWQKRSELTVPVISSLKVSLCPRKTSFKCTCLGSMVPEGATILSWVPFVDQALLMASLYLTYMAGVIPVKNSYQKGISNDKMVPESSTSSGRTMINEDQDNPKHALDVVKNKLLDSLDLFERGANSGNKIPSSDERGRQPLNLNALADGPRLRLLWASFQRIEEEVNNVSKSESFDMDNRLTAFSKVIQRICQAACITWLEGEHCLANSSVDVALVSMLRAKLNMDNTALNIKSSGKEDLYADLLCFLCFGSIRPNEWTISYLCVAEEFHTLEDCCYDKSLFISNGISILEDLVITLADGIASLYLELISVDSNVSHDMNSLSLALCALSTRALQKLRNEVALNKWLYENVESVVSMYEDRFDLCTLKRQLIEESTSSNAENSWWKRLTQWKSKSVSSSLCYVVISQFSMPVKRIRELRALTGWKYYFSLFLELSDITMPMIRVVVNKISDAISFFLVTLIGRSLGLIYTGIRQSLRWK